MSAMIVWLDTHEAKLFRLLPTGVTTEKIHHHGKSHHNETLGRNHSVDQSDEGKFYADLTAKLKTVAEKEWLLAGPGIGRKHFVTYLEKNASSLLQYVKGNEAMDAKLTDNQIVAEGRKFFKHEHVFESI